jgi:hypothetical protein
MQRSTAALLGTQRLRLNGLITYINNVVTEQKALALFRKVIP